MGQIFKTFKQASISNFIASTANNNYYFFTSHPVPVSNTILPINESFQEFHYNLSDELLFGKKLQANDFAYLAPRHDWQSNTVYTQYDNSDVSLFSNNFFVITDENKVFKCLYNNNEATSQIKPTLEQNLHFTTSDGYVWKYLFTLSPDDVSSFATSTYIPVVANSMVTDYATQGIDIIDITSAGAGYITTNFGTVQSINQSNTQIVQIDSAASADNDFYNKCAFYVSDGPAKGAIRVVDKYISNNSGKWVVLSNSIPSLTASQSQYQINPYVKIDGDGTNAQAIVTINTENPGHIGTIEILTAGSGYVNGDVVTFSGVVPTVEANVHVVTNDNGSIVNFISDNNGEGYKLPPLASVSSDTGSGATLRVALGGYSINNVVIINSGNNYSYANISLLANTSYGFGGDLKAYIAPPGGHGSDVITELGVDALGIHCKISNNDFSFANTPIQFSTVGICKNPTYASNGTTYTSNTFTQYVSATLTTNVSFLVGESVVGQSTQAKGVVAFSNNSTLFLVGDNFFANNEAIISNTSLQTATISTINNYNTLDKNIDVLYAANIYKTTKSDTNEDFKLVIKF